MKGNFGRDPIVVIGGGVAGLAAASLLARKGFSVRIFEAGNKLGGCCATTTLDGYTFNDGARYVALTDVWDHALAVTGLSRASCCLCARSRPIGPCRCPMARLCTWAGAGPQGHRAHLDAKRLQGELRGMLDKWQP